MSRGNDRDGDGLSDVDEAPAGTNPDCADSDGDGEVGGTEVDCCSSPIDPWLTCASHCP